MDIAPEYKKVVDLAADKELDFVITNSSVNHARYVIKKIMEKTKQSIFIFSENLNNEIYLHPEILNELKKTHKIDIKVLLRDYNQSNIKVIRTNKSLDSNLELKKLSEDAILSKYFIVADEHMIRVESKEEKKNVEIPRALVNFNSKKFAKEFKGIFLQEWERASEIK